ncbi:MAG: ExbD/TolR family protein [Cellvibrionaceae bacterium]
MIGSTFLYQKKKNPFAAKLSLVSLMDIFTILVFFLLLNSGESENIENARFVELPKSTTGTSPHKELTVSIGKQEIWFEGEVVATIADVVKDPNQPIENLAAALTSITEKKEELTGFEEQNGFSITIMGDKNVPYVLLKSVMTTCRLHNYRNISLAVNQIGPVVTSKEPVVSAINVKPNSVGG